jgi:hypothetical protein
VQKRKIYFDQDLIAENRRLKEALAACNGILEVRDAALAAAEAMGLSYEVLGLFSAGLTLLLAIVRALWVRYRGTPFVVDRIDQLTIFINCYLSVFFYIGFFFFFFKRSHSCIISLNTLFLIPVCLLKTQSFMHYSTIYIILIGYFSFHF